MNVADFINVVKREGRYGTSGVNTDQATVDILNALNIRSAVIWNAADWQWTQELLAFTLAPNTRQYVVVAASSLPIERILNIIPYDTTGSFLQGKPWIEKSNREFYDRYNNAFCTGVTDPNSSPFFWGGTVYYTNVGQDAQGRWQIVISPVPNVSSKIGGFAKMVLGAYTMTDVTNNIPLKYFPNNVVLDALLFGCLIDVARIQGATPEATIASEAAWKRKIHELVGNNIGVALDNTPPISELPIIVGRLRARYGRRRGW